MVETAAKKSERFADFSDPSDFSFLFYRIEEPYNSKHQVSRNQVHFQ